MDNKSCFEMIKLCVFFSRLLISPIIASTNDLCIVKCCGWLYQNAIKTLFILSYLISSGWVTVMLSCHNLCEMQYVVWMTYHTTICLSDDLSEVGISSGWVMEMVSCHPWHTLPLLTHSDETSDFDFSGGGPSAIPYKVGSAWWLVFISCTSTSTTNCAGDIGKGNSGENVLKWKNNQLQHSLNEK